MTIDEKPMSKSMNTQSKSMQILETHEQTWKSLISNEKAWKINEPSLNIKIRLEESMRVEETPMTINGNVNSLLDHRLR